MEQGAGGRIRAKAEGGTTNRSQDGRSQEPGVTSRNPDIELKKSARC